ncbi:hypothetical protein IHE44_0014592 [Lamprotornis superbus]|uniref:PX domain-containing protein n=1 Tax=Lamprotornis superbus TaxID=245042 RepID=A0A835U066_9PASS|nr:hypothetical protein IHE44_0014592 [Lamprotornis superbus]
MWKTWLRVSRMEDCLAKKMEITVSEAEKRTGRNAMNIQETYTAYLIETRAVESQSEGQCAPVESLWRRYSEFELLRNYLSVTYPHIVVPPLPEKREGGWKEMVNETGFQLKADSRLKALNATFRVKNPDNEWSAIEKEMGDGLQSAGHHMDVYAASIDDILEEEEHYADQLKEYLFYAEALRAVCRKHELMQYDLEMAAQDLTSKKQQCEELATGTVRTFSLKGMTSKLFGQETPEQREAKIKVLEEQIQEGEEQLKSKNLEGRDFVKSAWADIERFKEQKNHDLKEALISYAVMQISMCKKESIAYEGSCKWLQKIKGDVVVRLPGMQRWKIMESEGKGNPDRPLVGLQQELAGLGIRDPAGREVKATFSPSALQRYESNATAMNH